MPLESLTPAQAANQLTRGHNCWVYWPARGQQVSLTYAYRLQGAPYNQQPQGVFSVFNTAQILQTELALQSWADVANITLTRVYGPNPQADFYSDNASILFGNTYVPFGDNDPGRFSGYTYLPQAWSPNPSDSAADGDVWINSYWSYDVAPVLWNKGLMVLVHEIGHAFGLDHPSDYNGYATSPTYATSASYREDDTQYTVMSYFSETNTGADYHGYWACAPMLDDIAAIQMLYGVNTSTRSDNTVYGFHSNTGRPWYSLSATNSIIIACIWDGGGTDTIDLSGFGVAQLIDLQAAHFSNVGGMIGNLSIAQGVTIENAIGGSGADTIIGNAAANVLNGGDEHDTLTGGAGNDTLDGGSNIDMAVFAGNLAAYTITQGATGVFTISGGDGADILTNIEYAKFDDTTMRLLPGSGTTINWSADPATYMAGIRDFDGNDLGAASGWKLIGTADVNGDGTVEHILVNRQNGRWAEVSTEADGKSYMSNFSWAGDTRVVGIYIDPLVTQGIVQQGSDFDSQRRFQNDLNIENIHGVLGQNDYNHDGLQEIYFSLTDGTAYLHAYMHADGNIQYANYQNEQQVKDYLTSNGFGSTTWAGWFPAAQTTLAALSG